MPCSSLQVVPDRWGASAVRFRQASLELNDLGRVGPLAAAVDLQGTPSGSTFAHAWDEFARAYEGLAKSATAIGTTLNQNALKYREADSSPTGNLDGDRPARNRHLERAP